MLSIILTIIDDDDRDFVGNLYEKYEKKLYLVANKYLNDHYDAQDCVHDTIKKVMEDLENFKLAHNNGYVEKLLMVTCRNCAINMAKDKERKFQYEQTLARFNYEDGEYEDMEIPDYNSRVDKLYISEENCNQLYRLINELDDKYRDIIIFKSLGLDYKNIAAKMNISEDLVRKRYSRAKILLWEMGGKDLYVE